MPSRFRDRYGGNLRTRQSLLERVKDWDDRESWDDFFDTYAPLLFNVARRAGLGEADAEDAVQDALLTVARRMPNFSYDPEAGSFKGWLLQVTRCRVIDHWRRQRKHRENAESLDAGQEETIPRIEQIADPSAAGFEAIWEDQWQKDLLEAAKERVKAKVKPRQYQIFHCAVVKEWPALRIARDLRVNLGQVYFARRKVEKLVREEVRRLERAEMP